MRTIDFQNEKNVKKLAIMCKLCQVYHSWNCLVSIYKRHMRVRFILKRQAKMKVS
jgi:hypothetical protein